MACPMHEVLSALPPEADIRQRIEHVCFVPSADIPSNPFLCVLAIEKYARATYNARGSTLRARCLAFSLERAQL